MLETSHTEFKEFHFSFQVYPGLKNKSTHVLWHSHKPETRMLLLDVMSDPLPIAEMSSIRLIASFSIMCASCLLVYTILPSWQYQQSGTLQTWMMLQSEFW